MNTLALGCAALGISAAAVMSISIAPSPSSFKTDGEAQFLFDCGSLHDIQTCEHIWRVEADKKRIYSIETCVDRSLPVTPATVEAGKACEADRLHEQ